MKLLTEEIKQQLLANHKINQKQSIDHQPVVKFFGGGACTWLITEMDELGIMFGLCDLGVGFPELGYVDFNELSQIRFSPFGLSVERDIFFKADKTLSQYADEAYSKGRIIT